MKISNSTSITSYTSKMVETPDNFIMNGHLYDKYTLAPIPLSFCPLNNVSNNCEMLLYQTAYVYSNWYKNYTSNGSMIDNNDPNVFYVTTQTIANNKVQSGVYKITKNANGTYSTIFYPISGSSVYDMVDIICQDNQRIYYTWNRQASNAWSYIGYIDKSSSFNTGNYVLVNSTSLKILKITDMYIYFQTTTITGTLLYIGKYNKMNNSITYLLQDTITNAKIADYYGSDMDNNVFYIPIDGIAIGLSDHFLAFKKYIYDPTKETITASVVTVDYSIYSQSKILINSTSAVNHKFELMRYKDNNTGKRYITCIVYNGGTVYVDLNPLDSAMYTFEIVNDDNWKLVSWTSFNPIIYKTMLPLFGNQVLILAYENGAHIYTWNTGTTSYQKVSSFDTPIFAVGCDNNNNIYIQYPDTSIDMISNSIPINVYRDFQQDQYQYNNQDILTNIIVYVQNYKGEYKSTTLNLHLHGNCIFTENSSKDMRVTTSDKNISTIPVTITGKGNLMITYEFV